MKTREIPAFEVRAGMQLVSKTNKQVYYVMGILPGLEFPNKIIYMIAGQHEEYYDTTFSKPGHTFTQVVWEKNNADR